VPADLLDDLVIEMPGVAQEVLADLVGVLQAAEHVIQKGDLPALSQLRDLDFPSFVDVLHPGVVVLGAAQADVLLEFDNVRVRDDLGVLGRKERCRISVDALMAEGRRSRSISSQAECDEPTHDGGGVSKDNGNKGAESIRVLTSKECNNRGNRSEIRSDSGVLPWCSAAMQWRG
jgi:hypothetical protein